jgi:ADP-ribose pyrophosphatase YjhB (NUDIX family)
MYELGVRAILKDDGGNILLVKNKYGVHAGKWVLPGGKVEKNEITDEAIKREVREELNLVFEPTFVTYHQDIQSDPEKGFLTIFFAGNYSGTISKLQTELSEYKFFTPEEIEASEEIGFGHKEVIMNVPRYDSVS